MIEKSSQAETIAEAKKIQSMKNFDEWGEKLMQRDMKRMSIDEQNDIKKQQRQANALKAKKQFDQWGEKVMERDMKWMATESAANAKAEAQAAKKVGYINELKIQVQQLEQRYYALTKAELQGEQGTKILTNLKEKRAELSQLQQAYGNYGLQVGHYSSATKMLGINLGQVMKEMPNFAISARIGIMSLTNNLPMLAESIQAVKLQQKEMLVVQKQLIAQGKIQEAQNMKIPSMWKLVGASIFGVTGIMSLLMVAMQLWGADIIKWIGGLIKGEAAVKKLTAAQMGLLSSSQTLNKVMKDGGGVYGDAVSSIEKMKVQLEAARGNTELSRKALDDYNGSLGVTFGKATDVDGALKNITHNEEAYIQAMQKMAFANAFFAQSAEAAVKIMNVTTKSQGELVRDAGRDYKKMYEEIEKLDELIEGYDERYEKYKKTGSPYASAQKDMGDKYKKQKLELSIEINKIEQDERARQIAIIQKYQDNSLAEATKYYEEYTAIFKDNKWKTEEEKIRAAKKETFDYEKELADARKDAIENAAIRELQTIQNTYDEKQKKLDEAYSKNLVSQIEYETLSLEYTNALYRKQGDVLDKYNKKYDETMRKMVGATFKAIEDIHKEQSSFYDNDIKAQLDRYKQKLQNTVNASDLELAIRQNYGQVDLQQQFDFLEAQRKQAVFQTKLEQGDVEAVERYYASLRAKIETDLWKTKWQLASNIIGSIGDLLEEGTIAQKIAATAQATINTYLGATAAFAQTPGDITVKSLAAAAAIAQGLASVYKIWEVKTDVPSTKTSNSTDTVTEKFHTGKQSGSISPNSNLKADEIHSTLLKAETVLDPRSSSIFDSLLNNIRSYGGSDKITSGVGVNDYLQEQMLVRAFSTALQHQKPQQISWTEFSNQAQRQQQLKNNRIIR
jgi:hypothetical protein